MTTESPTGPVRTRGLVLLAVVALAAGVAGGAIDRVWVTRQASASVEPTTPTERRPGEPVDLSGRGREEEPVVGREGTIPLTLRSLSLSDSQRLRIEQITAHFQPAADSIMRDFRPIADSVVRLLKARVAGIDLQMRQQAMCVLTPQQRDEWIATRRRQHVIVEENNLMAKLVTSNSCLK